jgi:hypothetical protein
MKIIAFSGTTFPSVLILRMKSLFCSVCKLPLSNTNLKGGGKRYQMDDSIKTLRNYSIVPDKTRISKMGTIANGKYLLFDLKFMALQVSVPKRLLLIDRG